MTQITLTSDPQTVIEVRRSNRARRLSLRVSSLDGRVTLTLPTRVRLAEAQAFADDKAGWIASALERQKPLVRVAAGTHIPVEGVERQVVVGKGKAARLLPTSVSAPEGGTGMAVMALLKSLARVRLVDAVDRYAQEIGRDFGRITLRDTRSRWGSCSQDGNLMFSWRLIMAPVDVLDYVAAHEVAHLDRMDHSPAFWGLVAEICPNYEGPRAWLRQEGGGLHRFRFKAD